MSIQDLLILLFGFHCATACVALNCHRVKLNKGGTLHYMYRFSVSYYMIFWSLMKSAYQHIIKPVSIKAGAIAKIVARHVYDEIKAKIAYHKDKREYKKDVLLNYKNKKAGVRQAAVYTDAVYQRVLGRKFKG